MGGYDAKSAQRPAPDALLAAIASYARDAPVTSEVAYERRNVNFAGDCVYRLQRHFVDCMLSGAEFESNGADYLRTLAVMDAVYTSAAAGQPVRISDSEPQP